METRHPTEHTHRLHTSIIATTPPQSPLRVRPTSDPSPTRHISTTEGSARRSPGLLQTNTTLREKGQDDEGERERGKRGPTRLRVTITTPTAAGERSPSPMPSPISPSSFSLTSHFSGSHATLLCQNIYLFLGLQDQARAGGQQ